MEKGQTNIKRIRNEYNSYIGDNFLIVKSYHGDEATKLGRHMIVNKKTFLKEVKPN